MNYLPPTWCATNIGDVGEITTGNTPSKKDPSNYGNYCPWVKPPDLNPTIPITDTEEKLSEKGASEARVLSADSVMVCCIGSLGKTGLAGVPLATNQQINSITFDERLVAPRYGFYYCQTLTNWLAENASATTVSIVNKGVFSTAPFVLAPRQEQDRIVAEIEKQFTRLDDAVAALKRVQANLKRYRASVLKAACEGRLVPTEAELARKEGRDYEPASELLKRILAERRAKWEADQLQKMSAAGKRPKDDEWNLKYEEPSGPDISNLPDIPEGWTWGTWEQISNWVTYGFTRPMPHVPMGIPIVTAKNVKSGSIDFNNCDFTTAEAFQALSDKDRPRAGDILVTKDGTIGRPAVVGSEVFCINQSVAVVWLRSCPLDREYLRCVIESEHTQKPIWAKARGVAIQHLSITDFAKLPMPIPPLPEQRRIAEELDRLLSVIFHLETVAGQQLRHSTSLRQSVLQTAFSGKLVPQIPNDEPASVLLARIRAERARAQQQKEKTPKATNGTSPANGQRRGRVKNHAEVLTPAERSE